MKHARGSLSVRGEETKERRKKEKMKGKYARSAPVYVEGVYTSLAVNMKDKKKKKRKKNAALLRS